MIYELKIPFKELYPLKPKLGKAMRFNFIVNDNDGKDRNKWIGITKGIGEGKNPGLYKKVVFLE